MLTRHEDNISSTSQLLKRLLDTETSLYVVLEPTRFSVKSGMRYLGCFFTFWGLGLSMYIIFEPSIEKENPAVTGLLSGVIAIGIAGATFFITSYREESWLFKQTVRLSHWCNRGTEEGVPELEGKPTEEVIITINKYNKLENMEHKITVLPTPENYLLLSDQIETAISEVKSYPEKIKEKNKEISNTFLSTVRRLKLFGTNPPATVAQATLEYLDCPETLDLVKAKGFH